MTREEFSALDAGDIVQGKSTGLGYIVTANYGDRVTAVRTMDITNPDEWALIRKAGGSDGRAGRS